MPAQWLSAARPVRGARAGDRVRPGADPRQVAAATEDVELAKACEASVAAVANHHLYPDLDQVQPAVRAEGEPAAHPRMECRVSRSFSCLTAAAPSSTRSICRPGYARATRSRNRTWSPGRPDGSGQPFPDGLTSDSGDPAWPSAAGSSPTAEELRGGPASTGSNSSAAALTPEVPCSPTTSTTVATGRVGWQMPEHRPPSERGRTPAKLGRQWPRPPRRGGRAP